MLEKKSKQQRKEKLSKTHKRGYSQPPQNLSYSDNQIQKEAGYQVGNKVLFPLSFGCWLSCNIHIYSSFTREGILSLHKISLILKRPDSGGDRISSWKKFPLNIGCWLSCNIYTYSSFNICLISCPGNYIYFLQDSCGKVIGMMASNLRNSCRHIQTSGSTTLTESAMEQIL